MVQSPAHAEESRSGRDPLLDLWRGLALVDMAWVHLANHPIGMPALAALWIGEHTRFAAGSLVLLSGLTVGHVFGPALRAGGGKAATAVTRLRRRALLLVVVGQLAGIGYEALDAAMRGFPDGVQGLAAKLRAFALFESPGVTGGLLLLYALLLLAVPLLERMRSRCGQAATMATSLALFAAAQLAGAPAHWPPWVFPFPHWQPLFVAGYLAAPASFRLLDPHSRDAARARIAVTAAFVVVFALRLASTTGFVEGLPVFRKVPLSSAELLWYLLASSLVLGWSAWFHQRSARVRSACAWLRCIGRRSLLVYVAHLLLEPPLLMAVDVTHASPWARMATLAAMTAAMTVVAMAADGIDAAGRRGDLAGRALTALRRLVPTAGMLGSGVAAVAMALVLGMRGAVVEEQSNTVTDGDLPAEALPVDILAVERLPIEDLPSAMEPADGDAPVFLMPAAAEHDADPGVDLPLAADAGRNGPQGDREGDRDDDREDTGEGAGEDLPGEVPLVEQ